MIHEHRAIDLYGKKVFEKVVVSNTVKNHNPLNNEACFFYVIEGNNHSYSEEESLALNPKEGVLMKCGNYFYKGVPDKSSKRLRFIAIHLYPDVLRKVYENNIPQFLKNSSPNTTQINMSPLRSNLLMAKYMESLLLYFDQPEIMNEELIELKLREFVQLLLSMNEAIVIQGIMQNLFTPRAITFKETIKAHIFSELSIAELAVLTNLSLASFKREFNKHFDDSPANYLKDQRLKSAAELLTDSDKRINDIAYDCLFNDPAHFSTAFKIKYKMSPSQYRLSQINK
jgi:AraC-like DNA-binding protein